MDTDDGDRILVCKLIAPRRWDLMVFRYPEDPTVNYVKRLVGLPGEKLAIRDGAVWINDAKIDPPAFDRRNSLFADNRMEWSSLFGAGSRAGRTGPR